ncbi:MAG: type I glyceraldehyde-3-phosphate dehydrogenase [Bacteroidia bacterium]|nr:type I glyceraldehyde-3-phosphate dehydrogenase [Bacteroidia bacterium]MDW8158460.1 type I glyceraldehyde-3-phosphate dehydrogenase [Bacteroidia bacterium]
MEAKVRVGINGFGRIGRLVTRVFLQKYRDRVEIIQINDLTDTTTLSHLFKYDSAHGIFNGSVGAESNFLLIDNVKIKTSSYSSPDHIPWSEQGVDIVLECTGKFNEADKARLHLKAGAKKVILSAPGKGAVDATIVRGVNDKSLTPAMQIISNASCTTNCLAPMVKVLDEAFGVERGFMNTVHAYTADQRLQDAPHKDLRRARAAAANLIPTTTGAAKAVGLVLPHLAGKLDGFAVRVPVINSSLVDLTVELKKTTTVEEINCCFENAAKHELAGILEYCAEPIVSSDVIGNSHSCIFDALSTMVLGGNLVKVVGWYDNEWGFSCRLAELLIQVSEL